MPWSTFGFDGQRKYLTRAEAGRFLTTARNQDISIYVFCWFITATGCRISEALMITAKSIDLEASLVIVESLKKRRKAVFRAIPLPKRLMDALAELIATQKLQDDDRIWPWSRMTGYRRVTEVMRRAGIDGPWATPKGLRHGFGVRAVQSGVPLHLVQRWLGHADMKTTAIYASAVGPEEREIASRTWLDQDCEEEKAPTATRKYRIADSASTEIICTDLETSPPSPAPYPPSPEIAKTLWIGRLLRRAETLFTCQLLHFYLFCNRHFPYLS